MRRRTIEVYAFRRERVLMARCGAECKEIAMGNAVCWFEIYVQDMQRAKAFYEGILQVELQQIPAGIEMWSFAMDDKLAGAGGALVAVPGVASGGNSTVVYFACVCSRSND